MSVPPIGASISLPLALHPSASTMSSLRKSRRGFTSSILNQWSPGLFDGPFTPSELRPALTLCFDSAVGIDGLPYSVFRTNLPWWQSAVLHFFNLVLSWGGGPHSVEAQHCGSCLQAWGPPFLSPVVASKSSSTWSKLAPHLSPTRRMSREGFRWGADSLVGSLVDLLTSRSSSHTLVAFIDIHKAFDTSGVEGTLVRLFDAGVSDQMWKLMSQFLRGTQSLLCVGSSLSHPWFDSGIAQGRVLSPLLFNLLVNGLAAVRRSAPGAQFFPTGVRLPCQLYADDVVIPADSESDFLPWMLYPSGAASGGLLLASPQPNPQS